MDLPVQLSQDRSPTKGSFQVPASPVDGDTGRCSKDQDTEKAGDLDSASSQRESIEYLDCDLVDIEAAEAMGDVSFMGTLLSWVLFPLSESHLFIQELWRHMAIFNY